MADKHAIGAALLAAGQDLGIVAQNAAQDSRFKQEMAFREQDKAAQRAWQEHLTMLQQQNAKDMQKTVFEHSDAQFGESLKISQQRADTAEEQGKQRLSLEGERLGIERARAENEKTYRDDTKKINSISSQLNSNLGALQKYQIQMQKELAGVSDVMSTDPDAQRKAITRKYKALIDPLIKERKSLKASYSEAAGVDYDDAATIDEDIPDPYRDEHKSGADTGTGMGTDEVVAPMGSSKDKPILVSDPSQVAKLESGTWVKFPNGTLQQVP